MGGDSQDFQMDDTQDLERHESDSETETSESTSLGSGIDSGTDLDSGSGSGSTSAVPRVRASERELSEPSTAKSAQPESLPTPNESGSVARSARGVAGKKSRARSRSGIEPNNVRKLRQEAMMSKAELARRAGVSPLTIDRVEAGCPCRMDTKRKILEALGLKPSARAEVWPDIDAQS